MEKNVTTAQNSRESKDFSGTEVGLTGSELTNSPPSSSRHQNGEQLHLLEAQGSPDTTADAQFNSTSQLLPSQRLDFGDGGAFPEIAVAQYPLGMGQKKSTSNALAVQLDAEGKIKYDAIAKHGHGKDKVCENVSVKKMVYLFVGVFVLGLVIAVVILAIQNHQLKADRSRDKKPSPNAETSQSSGTYGDDNDGYLCINDKADCENGRTCFYCKTEVGPHLDRLSCHKSENIKNESCYLCGETCLTYSDLLHNVKEGNRSFSCQQGAVEITCCVLQEMGNLGHFCGEKGQFVCYKEAFHKWYNKTVHEPVCKCPAKSAEENCDKTYTQMAHCKCFKLRNEFCDQERIKNCTTGELSVNWTQCHYTGLEKGVHHNCLCNKTSETEGNGDLRMCPDPDADLNQ